MCIDKNKTPLFIAQGANDARVRKTESEQKVEALKERGVDVQYRSRTARAKVSAARKTITSSKARVLTTRVVRSGTV